MPEPALKGKAGIERRARDFSGWPQPPKGRAEQDRYWAVCGTKDRSVSWFSAAWKLAYSTSSGSFRARGGATRASPFQFAVALGDDHLRQPIQRAGRREMADRTLQPQLAAMLDARGDQPSRFADILQAAFALRQLTRGCDRRRLAPGVLLKKLHHQLRG